MKTFLNPGTCVVAVAWGADVTTIEKTSTDECLKTEGHVDEDELRRRAVTLHPGGGANDREREAKGTL
ncbi:MAG: hypothetical protein LBD68_01670 [Zoogloeaceae bacterium]|nr:hypothetical protein [Zoogloeaceae bacterium]